MTRTLTLAPPYVYGARILRVIDADTYDVEVDVGFRMVARLPLRLAHVDAPEHNTQAGQDAITFVKALLGTLPCPVVVTTFKPTDKYGRYLAEVLVGDTDLAGTLLAHDHAKPYEGGTKS